MKSTLAPEPNVSTATSRRHMARVVAGAALGALFLDGAVSGLARKKGGRKKKVCKCAPGFHCQKGKCVPDA